MASVAARACRVNSENHMTFRLLRRLKGFNPGPSEQQPIGIFKWIHAAAIINRKIFAFFVLYRDVLISTSRRDARLTWMRYRDVRMSRETGCRERPPLRQIITLNQLP